MGRIYSVAYSGTVVAASGDTDFIEITPADDKPIKLRGFSLGQSTEVGDAQEEGIRVSVIRLPATVTAGSGANSTAKTPAPMDSADAAAGFTAKCNNAVVATTNGTAITLEELGWNERNTPYEHWYPDDRFCPKAKQTEVIVVRCQTTIADDMTFQGTFWIEEE